MIPELTKWGDSHVLLSSTTLASEAVTQQVSSFLVWKELLNSPAGIHCCHRWSGRWYGTWFLLCSADDILFCTFRRRQGCILSPIWFWVLLPCICGIFDTRFLWPGVPQGLLLNCTPEKVRQSDFIFLGHHLAFYLFIMFIITLLLIFDFAFW